MVWDRAHNEALIRIYKNYPILYKANYPGSGDKEKRQKAYLQVVSKIQTVRPGTTLQEMKSRIKNLRSQYFAHKKKISQSDEPVKLWCYDNLKYIDEEEHELKCKQKSGIMKLELEDYIAENVENDNMDTMDHYFGQQLEEDILSKTCDESGDDHLHVDLSDAIENPFKAKRFRANAKIDEVKTERLVEVSSERSLAQSCEDDYFSESFAVRLNDTLDRANVLLSKLTYTKQSQNRPFIENLLLDLDKLPVHILRKTKWKITDIVYKARQEQEERKNSKLSSKV